MNEPPLRTALLIMRFVWLALLMGPILFMIVLVAIVLPRSRPPAHPLPMLNTICFVFFILVVPTTYIVRAFIFRRSGPGGGVAPAQYSAGNLIFWAACEGMALFGLIVAMFNDSLWPTIVVVALALALQAITFPVAGRLRDPNQTPVG